MCKKQTLKPLYKKKKKCKNEYTMLKTKNSDYNTLHTETPLLPFSSHSHQNQYGRLCTSGHRITLSLLESIRGGNFMS